ncbi:MAG TPA: hypothetical protein VE776_09475, partial [Actinomycetota bacterium]|nr:hypothetical protein [Actinomycetota bacterium]
MSIVLLAILAVMWVAFLLPVIAPRQRRGGWLRRHFGMTGEDGWRPSPDLATRAAARPAGRHLRVDTGRARAGSRPSGRSVL